MSSLGYTDTPFLPGGLFRVHDANRPQPPIVAPAGPATTPSDAIVLFGGHDASGFAHADGSECRWNLVDDALEVVKGAGDIVSVAHFGDMQLHLEFRTPPDVRGDGQGRGNSGVFLMNRYEIQVLDCFENPTYADGTVGGIYGQRPPLVNASRQPGEWQSYDILWTTPKFTADGHCAQPAFVTVLLNGIVLHNHQALIGGTNHKTVGSYTAHEPEGPIRLQDHGDPVRFRNIWVRPL